jgi:predicted RNA-binding Zn-ribbon protein involved in translation (DUF1610 family)
MLRRIQPSPPITASSTPCPQCGAPMRIESVESDLNSRNAELHRFQCMECGLPRTYAFELGHAATF